MLRFPGDAEFRGYGRQFRKPVVKQLGCQIKLVADFVQGLPDPIAPFGFAQVAHQRVGALFVDLLDHLQDQEQMRQRSCFLILRPCPGRRLDQFYPGESVRGDADRSQADGMGIKRPFVLDLGVEDNVVNRQRNLIRQRSPGQHVEGRAAGELLDHDLQLIAPARPDTGVDKRRGRERDRSAHFRKSRRNQIVRFTEGHSAHRAGKQGREPDWAQMETSIDRKRSGTVRLVPRIGRSRREGVSLRALEAAPTAASMRRWRRATFAHAPACGTPASRRFLPRPP